MNYDPAADYSGGHIAFEGWLRLTDKAVRRKAGLSLFDLADTTLYDFFEDGITPSEAATLVLSEDDTFGGFFA